MKRTYVWIGLMILTNVLTLVGTKYVMLYDPFSDRTEMKKQYPYSGNEVIVGGKLDQACRGYAKDRWSIVNDGLKKKQCLLCIYWYEYTECVKQYEKRIKGLENKRQQKVPPEPPVG